MALRAIAVQAATVLRVSCRPSLQSLLLPLSRSYSAANPENLKYSSSHEWVKVEGDVGTIGITDHAQEALGDVVYTELPEPGASVKQGAKFGVVESVKAASDVYSPVSGEVIEVNKEVVESPALVNKNAFGDGWLIKVNLTNKGELDSLLDAKHYTKHVEESH